MKKILKFTKAVKIIHQQKSKDKKVVLVGGVFDILHFGHVRFLQEAKRQGDILIVALEPDSKVKKIKGKDRPVNNEGIRAQVVAALSAVDYVLILPKLKGNKDYQNLTRRLSPDVIAVTEGDPKLNEKLKQARMVKGKLKIVTPKIPTPSSSRLIKLLALE